MSKKRKIKRDKLISDLRKKLQENQPLPNNTPQRHYSLENVVVRPVQSTNKILSVKERDYSYVKKDMIKTFSIMSILLGLNVLLFILTAKNIINLDIVGL